MSPGVTDDEEWRCRRGAGLVIVAVAIGIAYRYLLDPLDERTALLSPQLSSCDPSVQAMSRTGCNDD
jgi:hypothetical protein